MPVVPPIRSTVSFPVEFGAQTENRGWDRCAEIIFQSLPSRGSLDIDSHSGSPQHDALQIVEHDPNVIRRGTVEMFAKESIQETPIRVSKYDAIAPLKLAEKSFRHCRIGGH